MKPGIWESTGRKAAISVTKVRRIGIIAEDRTDFNAAKVLISRITGKNDLSYKPKIGNGSGRIKSKCLSWSNELANKGCDILILIHDLDRNNIRDLRLSLQQSLGGSRIEKRYVCIPVEELEAWFICDPPAIKAALNLSRTPKFKGLPESIPSPKERLRDQIMSCSHNEVIFLPSHNYKLAEKVSLDLAKQKSPSFRGFHDFLTQQNYN